jgi:hypothetical protein
MLSSLAPIAAACVRLVLLGAATAMGDEACVTTQGQDQEASGEMTLSTQLGTLAHDWTEKIVKEGSPSGLRHLVTAADASDEPDFSENGIAIRVVLASEAILDKDRNRWLTFRLLLAAGDPSGTSNTSTQNPFNIKITGVAWVKRSWFRWWGFGGPSWDMYMHPTDNPLKIGDAIKAKYADLSKNSIGTSSGSVVSIETARQNLRRQVQERDTTKDGVGKDIADEDSFWRTAERIASERKFQECEADKTCTEDDHLKSIRDTVMKNDEQLMRITKMANFYSKVVRQVCRGEIQARPACACFSEETDKFQNFYFFVLRDMATADPDPKKDYQKMLRAFAQRTCAVFPPHEQCLP